MSSSAEHSHLTGKGGSFLFFAFFKFDNLDVITDIRICIDIHNKKVVVIYDHKILCRMTKNTKKITKFLSYICILLHNRV